MREFCTDAGGGCHWNTEKRAVATVAHSPALCWLSAARIFILISVNVSFQIMNILLF